MNIIERGVVGLSLSLLLLLPGPRPPSLEDRVARLEAVRAPLHLRMNPVTNAPYLMIDVCTGIETEYWCRQAQGQGAAFAVGTASDKFAAYFELDGIANHNGPSSAVYAVNVAPNADQINLAITAIAANAPAGAVALYGAAPIPLYLIEISPDGRTHLGVAAPDMRGYQR